MNALRQYDIPILKLEQKRYEYEFEGDSSFFEALEQDLIKKGWFKARVSVEKGAAMLMLTFDIEGSYELVCDRSLDPFDEPFSTTEKLILKYGSEPGEITDEIEIIAWDTPIINVARYLFEFIGLTVPMKKLHPSLRPSDSEEEDDQSEGILIYTSKDPEPTDSGEGADAVDPRWQALSKLKSNGQKGSDS